MTFLDVTHVTLRVPGDLRTAEAVYAALFEMTVAWREPVPDGAPFDVGWAELDAAGVAPIIVMLHAGAFRLAITQADRELGSGPIDHVGLQVTPETLAAVAGRVSKAGLAVVAERRAELLDFVDSFGVEWELDTRSFADPVAIVEAKRRRALNEARSTPA